MTPLDHIKLRLKNFTAASPTSPDLVWEDSGTCSKINSNQFPVPQLLLFLLQGVCGLSRGYRGEKMHWIVPFTYNGYNYAISDEKFGLYFYAEKGQNVKKQEILGKLQKAIEVVEKHILNKIANDQILNGNVSIYNQFNALSSHYDYFRQNAVLAYSPNEDLSITKNDFSSVGLLINNSFRASREGGTMH